MDLCESAPESMLSPFLHILNRMRLPRRCMPSNEMKKPVRGENLAENAELFLMRRAAYRLKNLLAKEEFDELRPEEFYQHLE